MNNFKRRLAKVEAATAIKHEEGITLIVRRIVRCGSNGEVAYARYGDTVVHRHAGESEEDFLDRAEDAAMACSNGRCVRMIISELDADL